jgi:2-aminoadipate transaminase
MQERFAKRLADVPRSFIREILGVALDPEVISFAGGLPNPALFPVGQLKDAASAVFDRFGGDALQYAGTQGYEPLRETISRRYKTRGLDVPVESILITTGSQQGLDLLGKVLINPGDDLIIEEPGYLGAIQAFSLYQPRFNTVPVGENGMDIPALQNVLAMRDPKLMYAVPNFQNPSGISYPPANRQAVAEALVDTDTLLIEDDPYGELRFSGTPSPSFMTLLPEQTVLLGSFSKTVVPAMRLGWIVAPDALMAHLITAKQAADLHSDQLAQLILHQYLTDNDLDGHINAIIDCYGRQKAVMEAAITKHFPSDVHIAHSDGGMFLWATLPNGLSAMKLFNLAIKKKVAFVPGDPFYIGKTDVPTLRLNFSNTDESMIDEGIRRLGEAMEELEAQGK